jgi:hypothetical protein
MSSALPTTSVSVRILCVAERRLLRERQEPRTRPCVGGTLATSMARSNQSTVTDNRTVVMPRMRNHNVTSSALLCGAKGRASSCGAALVRDRRYLAWSNA